MYYICQIIMVYTLSILQLFVNYTSTKPEKRGPDIPIDEVVLDVRLMLPLMSF